MRFISHYQDLARFLSFKLVRQQSDDSNTYGWKPTVS